MYEAVKKTRSFRRFKAVPAPSLSNLEGLIELARLTPSSANKQPLKYVLVEAKERLPEVFSCLKWAGYLSDWTGPSEEEQPTAYIIILSDPSLNENPGIDIGIAAQTMLLGAQELGFGACLLGSIDRPRLKGLLAIPGGLEVQLVVALGTPGEDVVLTTVENDGDIRYWRDEQGVHFVPKRSKEDLIVKRF